MTEIFATLFTVMCVAILCFSGISCASTPESTEVKKQIVAVQRGDLVVSALVDGNLVMPQAFDLRFGAPGNVEDVFVEEGDYVKAGTVLAMLDDSSQQLDVRSANCSLQQALSNLYETVPAIQQGFMGNPSEYPQSPGNAGSPSYYPNSSVFLSLDWHRQEISKARYLFRLNKYDEAASELRIAIADLESCIKIFHDAIENRSIFGDIVSLPQQGETNSLIREDPFLSIFQQLQEVIELVKIYQVDVHKVQLLIVQGNYVQAGANLEDVYKRTEDLSRIIVSNTNRIQKRYDLSYPDKKICLDFYKGAEDELNRALALLEEGGLNSTDYSEALRIARHYMELCNAILGSNVMVLEHGLSLKNYQQYNVDLSKAAVALDNRKDDLLKTIIVAPFDGTVVSVGIKRNDILSAMDYSSRSAIQLVDTKAVKFQGLVDEIDILKIKTGQKAMIAVDAVPGKVFTGKVTFISPYGTASTSKVVKFAVTIEIDPSDVELKGGLSATADIAVSSATGILLVPLSAVTTTSEGSFVKVVSGADGQSERRQVTLGMQNYQFAEVLSGLKEGDKVLIEVAAAPVLSTPPPPPGREGGPPPR